MMSKSNKTTSRLDELKAMANAGVTQRRRNDDAEHRLQCACVKWFRLQYPIMRHSLFAVPNGGRRDAVTGSKLKAEGALPGVADLILLQRTRRYGALLIEMKTARGQQSALQRQWQAAVTLDGYRYIVCRSFEDFMAQVNDYLQDLL